MTFLGHADVSTHAVDEAPKSSVELSGSHNPLDLMLAEDVIAASKEIRKFYCQP